MMLITDDGMIATFTICFFLFLKIWVDCIREYRVYKHNTCMHMEQVIINKILDSPPPQKKVSPRKSINP